MKRVMMALGCAAVTMFAGCMCDQMAVRDLQPQEAVECPEINSRFPSRNTCASMGCSRRFPARDSRRGRRGCCAGQCRTTCSAAVSPTCRMCPTGCARQCSRDMSMPFSTGTSSSVMSCRAYRCSSTRWNICSTTMPARHLREASPGF